MTPAARASASHVGASFSSSSYRSRPTRDEARFPAGVAPSLVVVDDEELAAALDLVEARSVDTLAESLI